MNEAQGAFDRSTVVTIHRLPVGGKRKGDESSIRGLSRNPQIGKAEPP
jgi:hypothetical protein